MPIRNLIHPLTGEPIPLEEAPGVLEKDAVMPAGAVETVIKDLPGHGADPRFVTASGLCPETTCRREEFLKRFFPYDVVPTSQWDMQEGTAIHARLGCTEINVPGDLYQGTTLPACVKLGPDGYPRVELWPGVHTRGRFDDITKITGPEGPGWRVVEHKTTKYPKTFKDTPPETYTEKTADEWSFQLSALVHMVEKVTDLPVLEGWVWRIFRGSHSRAATFRKFFLVRDARPSLGVVPIMSLETMWNRLGDWLTAYLEWLRRGYAVKGQEDALKGVLKDIPLDGQLKQMFAGKKCVNCAVRSICFEQAEVPTFEF